MCGIAGTYAYGESAVVDEKLLEKERELLSHRGPDGAGIWISPDKKIGLAHRRLSIIDLSESANQPMCNEDGSVWVVFNGEIYNHQEIRPELEAKGHKFKTDHSDTEVIIHAFEEWGADCVKRFRGMFAFAIWDGRNKELWLARDIMGVKPLYYMDLDGSFSFASELKPLIFRIKEREINFDGLTDYLVFRSSLAPNTLIKGINKLNNGELVNVKSDGKGGLLVKRTRYFNLKDSREKEPSTDSYNNSVDKLDDLLTESVRYRFISDVPVALFLSGGVDSSLIAAISSKIFKDNKIKAFTLGLQDDAELDESKYAEYVAKKFGLDLTVKKINHNALDFLDEWLSFNDDLVSDPSALALFILSKEVKKQGYKVILAGDGSDELFGGYDWSYQKYIKRLDLVNKNFLPAVLAKFFVFILQVVYPFYPKKRIEQLHRMLLRDKRFYGTAEINSPLSLRNILNRKEGDFSRDLEKKIDSLCVGKDKSSRIEDAILIDQMLRLPNDTLVRTDRATMANGVEARVPFLDRKVVEFSAGVPLEYKMGKLFDLPKKIVKDLALKYFDKDFVYRAKMGFPIPVSGWLKEGKARQELYGYINERKIKYLNYNFIAKMYDFHLKSKSDFASRLFNVYVLEKYIRKWELQ